MDSKKKKRRRPNTSDMGKIVAASDRIREESIQHLPKNKREDNTGKISFDQWWMIANKKLKLRYYLKEIIKADFNARGAGKMELEDRYNEMARLFGYEI